MRVSSRFLLVAAVLLVCGCSSVMASPTTGGNHFAQAGYPTMSLFAGVIFVALGIFFGLTHGGADLRGSGSSLGGIFLILNACNAFFGLCMIFGPGATAYGGARVNTLGLQIMIGAAIGFYAAYTNLKAVSQALFVFALATVLSLAGSMELLNHSTPVYSLDRASCLSYFGALSTDYDRCNETGYLQFLRVIGLTSMFFIIGQIALIFVALSEGSALMSAKIGMDDNRTPLMGNGFGDAQQPHHVQPQQQQHSVYAPQEQSQQQQPVAQPYAGPATTDGAPKATPAYQAL